MLNKKELKEKLEKEKNILEAELKEIGFLDEETKEWEASPEKENQFGSDLNEMADRFEEFESRNSTGEVLEKRFKNILSVLEKIDQENFGHCSICGKEIEEERMLANPAATTCKEHLEE